MKRGLIISSLLVTLGFAAIPSTMLFQGSVSVGGKAVADGKHKLEIFLCTSAAMSEVSGCTSVFSDSVTSLRGYFSTILGVSTPLPAFDKPYFLELTVDSKKADSRIALTATPYALHATIADSAGKANYADSSSKSGTASLATLATKATFADSTAKSGVSTVADFATKATLADSSGKAGIATLANLATTATLADSAAKAGLARVADTAKALISGVAVKSVNGLTDVVNILAGSNLTAVTSGKSVTIASTLPLSSTAADSLKYSATKIVFAPNTEFITQPSFTISSSETGSYPDHSAIRLLGDSLMLGASYGNPGGSGGIGILLTPTAGGMGRFS